MMKKRTAKLASLLAVVALTGAGCSSQPKYGEVSIGDWFSAQVNLRPDWVSNPEHDDETMLYCYTEIPYGRGYISTTVPKYTKDLTELSEEKVRKNENLQVPAYDMRRAPPASESIMRRHSLENKPGNPVLFKNAKALVANAIQQCAEKKFGEGAWTLKEVPGFTNLVRDNSEYWFDGSYTYMKIALAIGPTERSMDFGQKLYNDRIRSGSYKEYVKNR